MNNKKRIFNTFTASQFNYSPIVWHFCSRKRMLMIEKIQERAIKFVFNDNDSNYSELLQRINKDTMCVQRILFLKK